jgi:ATP-dependent exoDNAse (exonuclease V) beta subunit
MQGAQRTVSLLTGMLQNPVGQWILRQRPQSAAELALTALADGSADERVIDCTFVEDGVRWIIDYKTARVETGLDQPALRQAAERYRPQLARYAALFAHEGLPIRKAVYFLAAGELVELD